KVELLAAHGENHHTRPREGDTPTYWYQSFASHLIGTGRLGPIRWRLMLRLEMARVILFTNQMERMAEFYRDVIGLEQVTSEKGWREFDAGSVRIALHSGRSSPGKKGPKITFRTKDVAGARKLLMSRGAKLGKLKTGQFHLCDGRDP